MIVNPSKQNLKAIFKNGIKSYGKMFTKFTISFENYEEEDIVILKPGSKVDLKIDHGDNSKWLPGLISQILDNSNGKFLRLMLDGGMNLFFIFKIF